MTTNTLTAQFRECIDTICSVRSGAMDAKQFKATVELNVATAVQRVREEERARLFEELKQYSFDALPYEGTMLRAYLNNYDTATKTYNK